MRKDALKFTPINIHESKDRGINKKKYFSFPIILKSDFNTNSVVTLIDRMLYILFFKTDYRFHCLPVRFGIAIIVVHRLKKICFIAAVFYQRGDVNV